jgi:hypothetical protein
MQQPQRITNLPVPELHRFTPPLIEEVLFQCQKIGLPDIEGEKFFAYYTSNSWHVGRSRMKVWRAALTGWKLRWQERTKVEIVRKLQPSINVLMIAWKEEMTAVEEALRTLRQPVVNRWLETDAQMEAKLKPWREKRDKLRARKAELLRNMGRVV